jgi:predicted RNA binding protein YcfA (HicA-like mRNA interferase family)
LYYILLREDKNEEYQAQFMPKKVRELKSMLLQAGFTYRPGKGSHTNWYHPLLSGRVTLSGKDSSDAKAYQEKDINNAIKQIEDIKEAQLIKEQEEEEQ